jgi:hypothetical protein
MKRILLLTLLVCLLPAGCTSRPAPAWLSAGHRQLENFKEGFLAGRNPALAELHFQRALAEIRRSGDVELLGRAWLTRMALQVAVLEPPDEGDYPRVEAARTVPANRHFFLFLRGDLGAVEGAILPAPYRPLLAALQHGDAAGVERALAGIDDPLSRLIAAGVSVRRQVQSEAILLGAVETASQSGWKRGLLAWLKRLQAFYESTADAVRAAAVNRRIDLIER